MLSFLDLEITQELRPYHANAGYILSLNYARLVILISTIYAVYCVKVRVGWLGVFLSINLAFLSNDFFNYLLQVYEGTREGPQFDEHKQSEPIPEDFFGDSEYSSPASESENIFSCKSSSKTTSATNVVNTQKSSVGKVVKADSSSVDEMRRILDSLDHYEALGLPHNKSIDVSLLRKEYLRMVCFTFFCTVVPHTIALFLIRICLFSTSTF